MLGYSSNISTTRHNKRSWNRLDKPNDRNTIAVHKKISRGYSESKTHSSTIHSSISKTKENYVQLCQYLTSTAHIRQRRWRPRVTSSKLENTKNRNKRMKRRQERSETNVAFCFVRTPCSTIPLQKGGPPLL